MQKVCKELNLVDRVQRTPFAALTARELEERLTLPIVMNPNNPWKLERFHALVALRKVGVVVESEDCIQLPEEEVTQPKDIDIYVTVNGTDKVKVKTKVVHWQVGLDGQIGHEVKTIWSEPKAKEKYWWGGASEPVRKTN